MTCCRSRSFSVSLDGMVSARSIRHLTTARLLWAGLWDAKSKYLLVWVALRCTLTVMFPDLPTVLRVSRNAMVWRFWDETDGSSTVNCMFGLIELRWSWNERKPFPSVYKTLLALGNKVTSYFIAYYSRTAYFSHSDEDRSCSRKFSFFNNFY